MSILEFILTAYLFSCVKVSELHDIQRCLDETERWAYVTNYERQIVIPYERIVNE